MSESKLLLNASPAWRQAYPTACLGVLAMTGARQPTKTPDLDAAAEEIEEELRRAFPDRGAIKNHPVMQAYGAYYKLFGNTYHVLGQVASVALKGKGIPRITPIVQAMFMAELKNMLLTAVHDLDAVSLPLVLDVAQGGEILEAGEGKPCKTGDMYVADEQGVISVITYGADDRTRVGKKTQAALFTTYGVDGVAPGQVEEHLRDMEAYVRLFAPQAQTRELRVYCAG